MQSIKQPQAKAYEADPREVFLAECLNNVYKSNIAPHLKKYKNFSLAEYYNARRQALLLRSEVLPPADTWRQAVGDGKIYLRTIFYVPTEIPYIIMNLIESANYVDEFLIVEANVTQVGEYRDFIFERYRDLIPTDLQKKLRYLPVDLTQQTVNAVDSNDGSAMHRNEDIIWDSFEQYVDLHDADIVITPDADEVLYRHMYPQFLAAMCDYDALMLPLNQFFYRMNYLWQDTTFWATQATRVRYYKNKPRPYRWRYTATRFPLICGCHFSWQLTIQDMIYKLNTYAHKDIYGHFANEEILSKTVTEKTYPFDPGRPFTIRELEADSPVDRQYYPESFFSLVEQFAHLLPPDFLQL